MGLRELVPLLRSAECAKIMAYLAQDAGAMSIACQAEAPVWRRA